MKMMTIEQRVPVTSFEKATKRVNVKNGELRVVIRDIYSVKDDSIAFAKGHSLTLGEADLLMDSVIDTILGKPSSYYTL
jgi:hypothetical protein